MSAVLPAWLDPLPDAAAQRALDGWAIEQRGIPGIELMERAGRGLFELVQRCVPDGTIAVVCGKGNNGGDGLVVARLLREAGREVDVHLLPDPGELEGDARTNLERLCGAPPRIFNPGALFEVAGIVDAVLGTGASGAPRGLVGDAVDTIAAAADHGVTVVACDVPSGVDASTGEVAGVAVRARATATFHAAKPGLWIAPGKQHAGEVVVVDIGIPGDDGGRPPATVAGAGAITAAVLAELPSRGAASTKFDGGSVLVCGGSTGLTGAPSLASAAAARAGAGYVTVLVPASLNLVFEVRQAEVMSVPLPDEDGALMPAAVAPALERLERADALVLGPGLGRAEGSAQFARDLAAAANVPLVLDADGLNAHAGRLEDLASRRAPTVLTPHGGELARLLGVGNEEVRGRRLALAREAAHRAGAIVVLKGDDTLVVTPAGAVAVSPGDAPALATAGTGDVLGGTIAALLARRVEPFAAACAGVELHRRAGRIVGERIGVEGAIAGDVIDALPAARRR
ncbi:bifunctional ADP-dependent NAD(P)H-hydrate dehydratase/NAD(P)H-hydrate epimerase [Conexibacter woesei]|uniref:Bifunctional NAD(P)H-hydrate repair enzyme n=1 Tax=Conexibacter woesei (strain DSM 14684 / CCUG 47730 / CIP 108061 / JCM 11494 / NBRC 100937 / ID131577) TaxID=469383 RepID=D3F332_CONWI|nr:bifunctional ADP-dependent NAD(P)H-hydrate dehydratase/NAD(P)H-hydrate epimerase [Conexibacter woesei]ADB50312.1 carbohydrate kinase, YjeF related protein [Conexibacter woesei DSM 14684]